MANPVLLWAVVGVVCLTIFLVMNPHFLYGKTNKNHTPFMQKRFARHPNGLVSTIAYDYEDVNDKRWWKFNEWDLEVQASVPEDVIVEQGAEYGNGFYLFRCNRDGSVTEWDNPYYKKYFDETSFFAIKKEKIGKESLQEEDLHAMSKQSFRKMISDGFDEDYAESQYSADKKLLQLLLKRRGGSGGAVGGETVGETEGD